MRTRRIAIGTLLFLAGALFFIFGVLIMILVALGFVQGRSSFSKATDLLGGFVFGFVPALVGVSLCSSAIAIAKGLALKRALWLIIGPPLIAFGLLTGGGLAMAMIEGMAQPGVTGFSAILLFGVAPVVLGFVLLNKNR